MYGADIARGYRVVNHDARDAAALREVATDPRGASVAIHRAYLDAEVRIVTGFIEPHLFAGYSGGGKGMMPGVAGRAAIMSNHSAAMVGHARATFGVTEGNPIFEEMRRFALGDRSDVPAERDDGRRAARDRRLRGRPRRGARRGASRPAAGRRWSRSRPRSTSS